MFAMIIAACLSGPALATWMPITPMPFQDKDKHGLAEPDRSTMNPREALRAHWITRSGRTHYYIVKDKLIMVDEGEKKHQTYQVVEEDNDVGVLTIRIRTPEGGGHEKTLRFDNKRTGLLETIWIELGGKKYYVSTIWFYVDDKTEPN